MQHLSANFSELLAQNKKIVIPEQSNTRRWPKFIGWLWRWWNLAVASTMVLVLAPPLLLFFALVNRRHWFYPFARWGARTWLKLSGVKVVVKDLESVKPDESVVFVSNHRSYLDTAAVFGHLGRRIGIPAKKELLKLPIFGKGMQFVNIIPIDRSNPEKAVETMQKATQLLQSGIPFVVFVEGTRARPGELLPFKKGAFYMALEAKVPIVPIAIKNTDVLMGKKTGFAQPGTLEMVILSKIKTDGLTTDDVEELRDKARAAIADELAKSV